MTKTFSAMDSTLSGNFKNTHPTHHDTSLEKSITKLYTLKEKFESMYYGQAECRKYDKARAFTIELNATLYEANQLQSGTDSNLKKRLLSDQSKVKIYPKSYDKVSDFDTNRIKLKIKELNKELNKLIH